MREAWRKIRYDLTRHQKTSNYSVSDQGRIRNDKSGRILKVYKSRPGNPYINLRVLGSHYAARSVAHLVAQEFIDDKVDIVRVKHKDGDSENCRLSNLYISSYRERGSKRIIKINN